MARKNETRKKDVREKRERREQPAPWEPIPLHLPVPDRRRDERLPKGDELGRGVVVIDFGG